MCTGVQVQTPVETLTAQSLLLLGRRTASPPTSQVPAVVSSGQTAGIVGPVADPPTPLVVIKQPEPVRPYTGTTSYKAYKEYFERICL